MVMLMMMLMMMMMTTNVPSDGRHLEFLNGRNERTVVGQQQSDDLESVEVLVTYDRAVAVIVGKLELCFHQQTVQHPVSTELHTISSASSLWLQCSTVSKRRVQHSTPCPEKKETKMFSVISPTKLGQL